MGAINLTQNYLIVRKVVGFLVYQVDRYVGVYISMYQRKKYVGSNYLGNSTTRTRYICRSPFVIVYSWQDSAGIGKNYNPQILTYTINPYT